jgi:IS1 family transposase
MRNIGAKIAALGGCSSLNENIRSKKVISLKAYQERSSLRGLSRVFGVCRQTMSRWLVEHITSLAPFRSSLLPAHKGDILELDELWSFVGHKGQKRWLWVALNRRTRQIVAFVIADRSAQACWKLWQGILYEYRCCHSYSDFWHVYEQLLSTGKHQLVGKETGQTARVERWNCTLRQRLGRYVRKTLSFSKSDKFHHLVTKWFIFDYNLSLTM